MRDAGSVSGAGMMAALVPTSQVPGTPAALAEAGAAMGEMGPNRPGRTPPGVWPDPGPLAVGTPAEAFEPPQDPGWQPDNFDQLPFLAPGGGFNTSPFPQKSRRHVIKAAEGS